MVVHGGKVRVCVGVCVCACACACARVCLWGGWVGAKGCGVARRSVAIECPSLSLPSSSSLLSSLVSLSVALPRCDSPCLTHFKTHFKDMSAKKGFQLARDIKTDLTKDIFNLLGVGKVFNGLYY